MRTPSDWNGFPKGLESAFSLGSSAEPSAHEPARHLRERCSVAFGAGSRYGRVHSIEPDYDEVIHLSAFLTGVAA